MLADSRNFHCWSYWRLLINLMGLSAEEQEAYVLDRIEDNFSNYSAWHERTRVLQALNTERPTLSLQELLAADNKTQAASPSTGMHSQLCNSTLQTLSPARDAKVACMRITGHCQQ